MKLQPGLVRTAELDVEETLRQADREGYTTFVLPTERIVDRATFFDAVRATLPLDPPLLGSSSWDAMSDSLWEGLHALPGRRIAILWPAARKMAEKAPSDFRLALAVLTDVANLLADVRATVGTPKELSVIVE